jgi:hypothetical protein
MLESKYEIRFYIDLDASSTLESRWVHSVMLASHRLEKISILNPASVVNTPRRPRAFLQQFLE